jgi:methyl-accepting chemotaxis protein/sigma-B regulation protein RsbU (phosphoserine phosphatase)
MLQLPKLLTNKLSVQISLKVVSLVAALLAVALFTMLHFSRRTIRQEAMLKAEQTLEGTVEHIDDILLSVEQSTGNIYLNMYRHLDKPEMMYVYSRRLVESNPYISGCAIAFEPYYYKDRGELFMAYYHRSGTGSKITQSESFGNKPYNQQVWYTEPMKRGTPCWTDPLEDHDANDDAIITHCLPIYSPKGERIGVVGVDVTINMLSRIVLSAKPSEHSYSVLLGSDGSFLVHPDNTKRLKEKVYTQLEHGSDASVKAVIDSMMTGQNGAKQVKMDGKDYYVFYKPFMRNAVEGRYIDNLGWSVGIVYPENDIFGDYNRLLSYVFVIAIFSLLILALLCQFFLHRRLLPLMFLTESSQRIANGHFDELVPESHQHDEIGQLQNHFQQMQQALAKHVDELEKLNVDFRARGERLRVTYHQAQAADRLKTSFLHNMTNQMLSPAQMISDRVNELWNMQTMKPQEMDCLADDIQRQGEMITELLNHLLELAKESTGKEDRHG